MATNRKIYNSNNAHISVELMLNADGVGGILAIAVEDDEYWFTIGWYQTEKNALRAAGRRLADHGYTLNI